MRACKNYDELAVHFQVPTYLVAWAVVEKAATVVAEEIEMVAVWVMW